MENAPRLLARKEFSPWRLATPFLSIISMVFGSHVNAGWFDYDTYEECMEREPGKLMTRWVNPLPDSQAMKAAREYCKAYPNGYQRKLRAMSDSELLAEPKKLSELDASLYPYYMNYVNAEIKRRNLK